MFILLLVFLLGAPAAMALTPSLQMPRDVLWKKRILVLCDLTAGDAAARFMDRMANRLDPAGLKDRDLFLVHVKQKPALEVWVPSEAEQAPRAFSDPAAHGAYVKLAKCQAHKTQLVLIGKDGGVKQRWTDPPAKKDIYNLIDAMPMRMQELRRGR